MKNISKLLCFLFLLILSVSNAHSQQLQIADFRLDETEQTANRAGTEKFDIDDNPCALLRLQTSEKGFVFDAGTIGLCEVDENQVGEIWVWLRPNTRFLSIRHAKLGTINRYEIPVRIEGKRTYYARLISGTITTVVEEAVTQQFVKFFVEPKDAMVTLDNQLIQLNDGYGYKMMRFGQYDYRVELADYHPLVGKIKVSDAEKPQEIHVSLKPAFGWIEVVSGVADGASVYIDNRAVGTAPLKTRRLPSGEHTVKIVKDKYATWLQTVTVQDEKTETIRPQLEAQFARVTFVVEGSQADIYINNEKKGQGSVTIELGYGPCLIECRKLSHRTTKRDIEITSAYQGQTIQLPAPEPIYGRLIVETSVPNATVYVDSELAGTAPLQLSRVIVGKRTITLKKQGYADCTKTIIVEEGKTASVSMDMQNSATVYLSCEKQNAQICIRKKGETDYRSLGYGTYNGELELGEYEAKTTAANCKDGITTFVVEASRNNRITLNPPKSKEVVKKTITVSGLSFNMIKVEGGSFTMGCTQSDCEKAERPAHEVTVGTFYIGETEVTQGLWQAVMGSNPSSSQKRRNYPVEQVSYNDCLDFISRLNRLTGMTFRLPTEAEWEYAARGGQQSEGYRYAGSNSLHEVAWYKFNSSLSIHPVATLNPNELGIYDMSGNVSEWCKDWYGSYNSASITDPTGAYSGSNRVIRGGNWYSSADFCRVSSRSFFQPGNRNYFFGLRLVLVER